VSSILGALSSAAGALDAQRRGLEVAGQNIANVNTVGYSRRTLMLAERAAVEPGEAGRGVEVTQVRAVRDLFLEARLRQEQTALSHDRVVSDALSVLEAQLGQPGASLDGQLATFFNAFSALAEDPASLTLRDAALRESDRVAAAFRDMAARFDQSRRDADLGMRGTVDEINRLSAELGRLNARLDAAAGIDAEALVDRRNAVLQDLADLADLSVSEHAGVMTVSLTSGHTLVSGTHVVGLSVEEQPGTGWARVRSEGQDITATLSGGRLGGWTHVRDEVMPGHVAMLDELAMAFASAANSVHVSGTDAHGAPGVALFDVAATVSGAAASLQVSGAVAADARLIVAASGTSNDAARAMAALRGAPLINSATTVSDSWGQLVYRVGADASAANRTHQGRDQVLTQLQRLREATSGVSLDEEAASLMRYQRAYEANARYFTVVNDILDVLLGLVR